MISAPSRIVYCARYHGNHPTRVRLDDLNGEKEADPDILYEISKVANLLTVREFARRHPNSGVIALAASPG